jgi:hypothetical protein
VEGDWAPKAEQEDVRRWQMGPIRSTPGRHPWNLGVGTTVQASALRRKNQRRLVAPLHTLRHLTTSTAQTQLNLIPLAFLF